MQKSKLQLKIKNFLSKAVPLWLVLVIVLDTTLLAFIGQYYLVKRELDQAIVRLAKITKSPQELAQILQQEVLPTKGYTTSLKWKDLGKQLVESGAINKKKYEEIFAQNTNEGDYIKYLDGNWNDNITIYFDKQGIKWKNIDPKLVLSASYSSAQGAARIRQSIQNVPGVQNQGGGCGA